MANAITIDLEDWFCPSNIRELAELDWDNFEIRVETPVLLLLDLLEEYNYKATFFVLGFIAQKKPDLIREINTRGHEIASHGYAHRMITKQTQYEFEEDLKKSLDILEGITSVKVKGYRAPVFTITNSTLWALDILLKNGIEYDSSIYPFNLHPDYGIKNSQKRIYRHENGIIEVPLSVASILGLSIPCSGGAYFRFYPYHISEYLLRKAHSQNGHTLFYIHPWEIDSGRPKIEMGIINKIRMNYNVSNTLNKLEKLFKKIEFTTIKDILSNGKYSY
ncbi:MAG: polysaccharide deacetylase and domain protein [Ignavibacteria bacterium]|nr:polysaccharide deacetylase and domain protein [Ignavibacteria bacterium]